MNESEELGLRLPADPQRMERLTRRLAERAAGEDLLELAYRRLDSPVGKLLVVATTTGVVRVAFEGEGHDAVLATLAETVSPRILAAPHVTDPLAREFDGYFSGTRHRFETAVDLRLARGFQVAVLERLADVSFGETISYARLAAAAGSPRAVRAVGTACARNPVPIIVPCHRVIRSDGRMGEYRGGAAAKQILLELEASLRR